MNTEFNYSVKNYLDLKGCGEEKIKFSTDELNAENVAHFLELAIIENDGKKIEECLAFMLAFPESFHDALKHFFTMYHSLKKYPSLDFYSKELFSEMHLRLSKCINLLDALFSLNSYLNTFGGFPEYPSQILLNLLLISKDRLVVFPLIRLMNQENVLCLSDSIEEMVALAKELLIEENIPCLLECIGILIRTNAYAFRNEGPQMFADMLECAFKCRSKSLLQACLEILYQETNHTSSDFYIKLYQLYPEENLTKWVIECLLQIDFTTTSKNAIEILERSLHFISCYTEEQLPTTFDMDVLMPRWEKAIPERDRAAFSIAFLQIIMIKKNGLHSFDKDVDFFTKWDLHREPAICKIFGVWLVAGSQNPKSDIKGWLDWILKFPSLGGDSFPIRMLKEYMKDLPRNKRGDIFAFLNFGINYFEDSAFLQLCLDYIERHQIHHLMPRNIECKPLFSRKSFEYEASFIFKGEEGTDVYPFPQIILKARASEIHGPFLMIPSFYGKEVVAFMMQFIAYPKNQDSFNDKSIDFLGKLFLLADEIGEVHCKGMAERKMFQSQKIPSWGLCLYENPRLLNREDFPLLQKMYPLARGDFQNKIKDILFAQACVRYSEDPSSAMESIAEMRKDIPESFIQVNMSGIFSMVKLPLKEYLIETGYVGHIVSIDASFLQLLKTLTPEIQDLNLENCQMEPETFEKLMDAFPDLKKLKLSCYHSNFPSPVHLNKNLKDLRIAAPNLEVLKAASEIPLEQLELMDFSYADELIDLLFKENLEPKFCETLHTLILSGCPINKLSSKKAALLLSRLPKLKELHLRIPISQKFLHAVRENCKELTAISIPSLITWPSSPPSEKIVQEFVEHFPTINHFSYSELTKQSNDDLFHAINALPILKTLEFHHFSDNTLCLLLEKHPELENLNIAHAKITSESLSTLSKFSRLQTLNLAGTDLSMGDILDISKRLPRLKSLAINMSKTDEEHMRIADILSNKGIVVSYESD